MVGITQSRTFPGQLTAVHGTTRKNSAVQRFRQLSGVDLPWLRRRQNA
jgi:hypothetical protein